MFDRIRRSGISLSEPPREVLIADNKVMGICRLG